MPNILPFDIKDVNLERPGSRKGLAHWYGVTEPGKELVKYNRVTTILDKTVPKPGLLVWSRRTALREVARLADSGPRLSKKLLAEYLETADAEPERVKVDAADWGTLAHEAVQRDVEALMFDEEPPVASPELQPVVDAFRAFTKGRGLTWFATEFTVWIPHWQVAGTMDAVAMDPDGNWVIMDWKTSNGFYPEQALQLGAYAEGFEHVTGVAPASAGIVRYPKEFDPESWFEVKWVEDLAAQRKQYGSLVELYQFLKKPTWRKEE